MSNMRTLSILMPDAMKTLQNNRFSIRKASYQQRSITHIGSEVSTMKVKDFLQIERKKQRALMIKSNFEKSNHHLNVKSNRSKGFKGSKLQMRKCSNWNKTISNLQFQDDLFDRDESDYSNACFISRTRKHSFIGNLTLYRRKIRGREGLKTEPSTDVKSISLKNILQEKLSKSSQPQMRIVKKIKREEK